MQANWIRCFELALKRRKFASAVGPSCKDQANVVFTPPTFFSFPLENACSFCQSFSVSIVTRVISSKVVSDRYVQWIVKISDSEGSQYRKKKAASLCKYTVQYSISATCHYLLLILRGVIIIQDSPCQVLTSLKTWRSSRTNHQLADIRSVFVLSIQRSICFYFEPRNFHRYNKGSKKNLKYAQHRGEALKSTLFTSARTDNTERQQLRSKNNVFLPMGVKTPPHFPSGV